jgi:hypothetical protein
MVERRKKTQVTGNTGMFFVCYKLSKMGWNVMPTARNAKGVDIIAYNSDLSKMILIQVKALSTRTSVLLGNTLEKVIGDFWIIVNDIEKEPQAFILLPDEVKKRAHKGEKRRKTTYWIPAKEYKEFQNQWDRIGCVD